MGTTNRDKSIFPIDIFPSKIIEVVIELNKSLNYPAEYLGSSILSASSIAMGNTHHVKVKNEWLEKPNLYMILVGKSGNGKTHPLDFAMKPIVNRDKESYIHYSKELSEYKQQNTNENTQTKPVYKKFILNDFTPESLIKIHSHNNRGVAIVVDELAGWLKNFGRYSKSSEQEVYLSLWNGGSITIDRKGDEPIRLDNTYVNIIGGIQTKVLPIIGKDSRNSNGFIERFLFVNVDNAEPPQWNDMEADRDIVSNYYFLIEKLFTLDFDNFKPRIVTFSDEAKIMLNKWRNTIRQEYKDDDISNSILAKYEVYTIRFSLIIQFMFWAMEGKSNKRIELFAVEKAIILTEYYFYNARKTHNIILNINPLDKLNQLEKTVYNTLSNHFTTKEALEIAESNSMEKRTLYRFLKNKNLFNKENRGIYSKLL